MYSFIEVEARREFGQPLQTQQYDSQRQSEYDPPGYQSEVETFAICRLGNAC